MATVLRLPSPAVVQVMAGDDEDHPVLRVVPLAEPSWSAYGVEIPTELLHRYEAARAEWVDAQNAVRQYLGKEPVPDEWLVQ